MTIHRIFRDITDFELARYGDKFRWSPINLVKTHVGIDYTQRRVTIMGEREEILRIDPTLETHPFTE